MPNPPEYHSPCTDVPWPVRGRSPGSCIFSSEGPGPTSRETRAPLSSPQTGCLLLLYVQLQASRFACLRLHFHSQVLWPPLSTRDHLLQDVYVSLPRAAEHNRALEHCFNDTNRKVSCGVTPIRATGLPPHPATPGVLLQRPEARV